MSSGTEQSLNDVEVQLANQMNHLDLGPDRVPRGIETEENRIYFY